MSVDPYSLCPGGTGKKLKFCCSDLLHELGKIDHMLAAEQRQACVDYIAQLEAKYPDRACLLTTKALVLHSLEQDDAALAAADRVLATQPTNPVALAVRAMVLSEGDDPTSALRPLHQALVACGSQVPQRVFEAVGVVAEALLSEGYVVAALAHLVWQVHVKADYEPALLLAYRIQTTSGVPLSFKDIRLDFEPAPEGVAYKAEFDAALREANGTHWLKAAEEFDALMFRAAGCAALWHNLGRLRAYLGNEAGAADALRRYASLDVPLDDAVEAEMLAHLLDPKNSEATVDQLRIRYQPADFDAAMATFSVSPMALQEPLEGLASDNPDEPPPRAMFTVLDRPMPESGRELTEQDLPELLGFALFYGRQTDREPRLELVCDRPHLERAKAALQKIVSDGLGSAVSEEAVTRLPVQQFAITGSWRVPNDTPPDRVEPLSIERRRRFIFEQWTSEPSPLFGGRSPRQAGSDRTSRIAVLAAIALWELNYGESIDFNELRRRLELPLAEPIDPTTTNLGELPLVRLHRLDLKKLSDEQLAPVWRRAVLFRARLACSRLAVEVASRPSMSAADRAQAHGMLASLSNNIEQGLEHLGRARQLSKSGGNSCAGWDLEELSLRLAAGKLEGFMDLVQHISTAHRNEPGVLERLFQFLYEAGLIDEQGRPMRAAAQPTSELVVPGGAAAAAGKIWTPGADVSEEKKSSLWVPGS
jgi:tetratricopeptide (TPR) repeat protein